jgi:hypothetical protein
VTGTLIIAILATGMLMDGMAYRHAVIDPMSLPDQPFAMWHVIVRMLTIVFFITWLDRVYGNIPALGHATEHSRVWATIAPILPPFCFVRPPQLMDEAWRASTPVKERESGLWLGYLWWAVLWSAPVTFVVLMVQAVDRHRVPVENARLLNGINIVAALFGMVVVYSLTSRQRTAADEMKRLRAAEAVAEARARKAAMLAGAAQPATIAEVIQSAPVAALASARPLVERRAVPRPMPVAMPMPRVIHHRRQGAIGDFIALLDAISAPVWISLLTWSTFAAGAAMLLAGGSLFTVADSKFIATIYTAFGVAFVAGAFVLRRQRDHIPERWRVLAAAAALLAFFNLVALPGLMS